VAHVHVTRATEADLPACAALRVLHVGGTVEHALDRLRGDRLLFVVRLAGTVAGYGRLTEHVSGGAPGEAPSGFYLGGLVVSPAHRRTGVGTALTEARMRYVFDEEGAAEIWYFANARNHASIALHERLGFEEVTRDFHFPGVEFAGGVGVLFRADRPDRPASRASGAR
jgi:RimJ/RimL family protein N-acetyltransferase